eukprot:GGOE01044715.1.p1 GENE.GGOE01044715.1~~GGOE01044715.1.p1  ORF type:complete len:296 (-),score=48.60 GGOE01044715.1:193-1080(-)
MGNLICGEMQLGTEFGSCHCPVTHLLADPDRRVVVSVTADGKLREWTVDGEWPAQPREFVSSIVSTAEASAFLSLGGGTLASGHLDGKILVWDADRRTLQCALAALPHRIIGLSWHAMSRTLVSADSTGACRKWTLDGRQRGEQVGPGDVWPFAKQAITFLDDALFRIVDPAKRQGNFVMEGTHFDCPTSEADCSVFAAAEPTAAAPIVLTGHMDAIRTITTHARHLFSAADDMTVRMWTSSGGSVAVFRGARRPLTCLAFWGSKLYVGTGPPRLVHVGQFVLSILGDSCVSYVR